jgi:hypothetical protein
MSSISLQLAEIYRDLNPAYAYSQSGLAGISPLPYSACPDRPIAFDELASLVELPDDLPDDSKAVLEIIAICGSFLTVREDTIIFLY